MSPRTLKTSEAAEILSVTPNTLRVWERKFGFPQSERSSSNRRRYPHAQIEALRQALGQGLAISTAVDVAQDDGPPDAEALITALATFQHDVPDRIISNALALRSLEETVDVLLLPSLATLLDRVGQESALWAFAASWAVEWLLRVQRLAGPSVAERSALIADSSSSPLDPLRISAHALTVLCRRSGVGAVRISALAPKHLPEAMISLRPTVIVVVGSGDDAARWRYHANRAARGTPILRFDPSLAARNTQRTDLLPSDILTAAKHIAQINLVASSGIQTGLVSQPPPGRRTRDVQVSATAE
ncbi:MAG: MerR family transcriptional regulator [Solirubrobacteraceae bacterium]